MLQNSDINWPEMPVYAALASQQAAEHNRPNIWNEMDRNSKRGQQNSSTKTFRLFRLLCTVYLLVFPCSRMNR